MNSLMKRTVLMLPNFLSIMLVPCISFAIEIVEPVIVYGKREWAYVSASSSLYPKYSDIAIERDYLQDPQLIALVKNLFDVRCAAGAVAGGFTRTTLRSDSTEKWVAANSRYNAIPASRNFSLGAIIVSTLGIKVNGTSFTVTYADGGTATYKVVAIGSQTPLSAAPTAFKHGDGIVKDKACAKA